MKHVVHKLHDDVSSWLQQMISKIDSKTVRRWIIFANVFRLEKPCELFSGRMLQDDVAAALIEASLNYVPEILNPELEAILQIAC